MWDAGIEGGPNRVPQPTRYAAISMVGGEDLFEGGTRFDPGGQPAPHRDQHPPQTIAKSPRSPAKSQGSSERDDGDER
jgi:hypothetical protein